MAYKLTDQQKDVLRKALSVVGYNETAVQTVFSESITEHWVGRLVSLIKSRSAVILRYDFYPSTLDSENCNFRYVRTTCDKALSELDFIKEQIGIRMYKLSDKLTEEVRNVLNIDMDNVVSYYDILNWVSCLQTRISYDIHELRKMGVQDTTYEKARWIRRQSQLMADLLEVLLR